MPIPADMVLMASLDPVLYVDTSGILGETRLSEHVPVTEINRLLTSTDWGEMLTGMHRLQGTFMVEEPNSNFEKFVGKFRLKGYPTSKPLLLKNFILRDSRVVNCKWAIGCVIYAGEETKTRLNTMASK